MLENGFYSILDIFANMCVSFSELFDSLFVTEIGGYPLMNVLLGAGLIIAMGWIIVKWVIPT